MSVQLTYQTVLTCVETVDLNVPAVSTSDRTLTHDGYKTSKTLNSGTTPPVTDCGYFSKALASGAATIDLTNFTGTEGRIVNATGLKVQAYKFRNPPTNTGTITVTFGAANGYLLGGAAWKFILSPGDEIQGYKPDTAPDVDSTHKNIDLAGTGTEALEVSLVVG